jgi:PAS domain S-box-containing protein
MPYAVGTVHNSSRPYNPLAPVPLLASAIVILLCGVDVLGWLFGLTALVRLLPGWPPMVPYTACSLMLAGTALLMLGRPRETAGEGKLTLRVGQVCAVLASIAALASLCDYLFGWGLGFERWLFRENLSIQDGLGRISPASSLALLVTASALLMLDLELARGWRPAQQLAGVVFIIALLAVLGYGYAAVSFYRFISRPGMPLQAAVAFSLLSVGILCARPSRRLLEMVTSNTAGAFMARRLLPAAIVAPSLLGLLTILGERAGHYDYSFGVSLLVATSIIVFLGVVWRNAQTLHVVDLRRQRAEKLLRSANDDLEERVEARTEELALANSELRREIAERRRIEEDLRRSQQELTDFFDNAPVGLHWVAPDGRIMRANQAELDLLGYTPEEYIGRNIVDFYIDPKVITDVLARLERGETITSYEARLRAKSGAIKYVRLDSNVLWDGDRFVHTRCFTRDITERKRAEEESARLLLSEQAARAQAEEAADLVRRLQVIIDISLMDLSLDELIQEMLGRIRGLLWADAAAILLLAENRRTLSACATVGFDPNVESELCASGSVAAQIARTKAPLVVDDVTEVHGSGAGLPAGMRSLSGVPLMIEGEIIGVIQVLTREVRRFSENDLRLLQLVADRVALAIEHARLYEVEQSARLEAEAANRMKDEFLATVSHELRSPLNAILGWVKLLRGGRLNEETALRALETIERSARAQSRIINDLLDTSRIVAGKLHLNMRPIEPARMIEAAVDAARPAAQEKAISLQMQLDLGAGPISGDPDRVQQIVWNLISNAIKFTPKGGQVEVAITRSDSHAEIRVSDTGVGIRSEFLPYVFDRFRQADASTTRRQRGLGLGLAIVRHLTELHGGTVHVESRGEGNGATFVVRLPRVSRATAGLHRPPAISEDGSRLDHPLPLAGLRVLVVYEDKAAGSLLVGFLRKSKADAKVARSKLETLEVLRRGVWQPDVLILDTEMPNDDGYALIREIRALESTRGVRLPAIALSAEAGVEQRMRALAAGFQMHLSKPVEPDELLTVVASLAGRLGKNTGYAWGEVGQHSREAGLANIDAAVD